MEGVSAAANIIAVVQLLERVATLCLQYGKAVRSAKADIERLQGELGRLKTVLGDAQKLLDSPNGARLSTSQAFCGMLKDCSSQLDGMEGPLKEKMTGTGKRAKAMSRMGFRALKWPFESEEVSRIVEALKECRDALSASLSIDQTRLLLDHFERVDDAECREILEWVSRVPYGKHHDLVKDTRTPGTCEWLLQHKKFGEWESASASVILWLQGFPGAGKTFLASKVVDHIQDQLQQSPDHEGFAFFYCNRNEQERRDPHSVLRSYVRQLAAPANQSGKIRKKLHSLWRGAILKGSDLSLAACREQLLESVNLYQRTTLVLDALDECDPGSRRELVETIESLLREAEKPLRIFISSRPDRDIRNRFLDRPNIEIQAEHNESDISKFVNKEIVKHEGWTNMSTVLREHIVSVLHKRNDGMFQWVFLQVKQILELETEAAIRDRLGKLPDSLEAAYNEIYGKIKARNKHDRALADRAFQWVMSAREPLTSEALLLAIRIEPDSDSFELSAEITESQLLHLCNNLLLIDAQRATWRVSHLSVAEYFEKNHWSRVQGHCHAAKVCLKLLLGTHDDDRTERCGVFHPDHPLQRYARLHWLRHIRTQEGQLPDPQLARLLRTFLGSFNESSVPCRRWYSETRPQDFGHEYRYAGYNIIKAPPFPMGEQYLPPEDISIIIACRYAIFTLLSDWWIEGEIDISRSHLLVEAAWGGSLPICQELIRRGIAHNLPAENKHHTMALEAAVVMGNTQLAEFLIELEPPVDTSTGTGRITSLITLAVWGQRVEMVKLLVGKGADVDAPNGLYGNALVAAAADGDVQTLQFLVDQGADITAELRCGVYGSALAAAASHGDLTNVEFLVKRGAEVNTVLRVGDYGSALVAAIAGPKCSFEVVRFLVERGADVNLTLQVGDYGSALAAAAGKDTALEILEFLVERGADVNMALQGGRYGNALTAAAHWGHLPRASFLLDRGAEVNMPLEHGMFGSALAAAVHQGDAPIWFYEGGYLTQGSCSRTRLREQNSMVQLLIERGADVNKPLKLRRGKTWCKCGCRPEAKEGCFRPEIQGEWVTSFSAVWEGSLTKLIPWELND